MFLTIVILLTSSDPRSSGRSRADGLQPQQLLNIKRDIFDDFSMVHPFLQHSCLVLHEQIAGHFLQLLELILAAHVQHLETVGDLVEYVAKLQTRQKMCGKVKLKSLNCWDFNKRGIIFSSGIFSFLEL